MNDSANMNTIVRHINIPPSLACMLCYVVLIVGYIPFTWANIGANDRDISYSASMLVMVLVAWVFGFMTWLWLQSLRKSRSSYFSCIGGIPYLCAILWILNDVDRVPVYLALLIVPATLFLVQKKIWQSISCVLALAVLLFCCLNPSIRIIRYAHNLRGDCFCCGYQQRDIHELILMGDQGCNALADCLLEETQGPGHPWCGWITVCSYAQKQLQENGITNQVAETKIGKAIKRCNSK